MSQQIKWSRNESGIYVLAERWEDAPLLHFKKRQALFYRGHLPYGVFMLTSGRVKLLFETNACDENPEHLSHYVPFGMDLIKMKIPYPCTGVAETDVSVLFLSELIFNKKISAQKNED